jgi:spore maturation protein A
MLNYIWAGLIIFALGFALWSDAGDLRQDVYRNGRALPVILRFPEGTDRSAAEQKVQVTIGEENFRQHFARSGKPAEAYDATIVRNDNVAQLRFTKDASLPQPLATIRDMTNDDKILVARVDHVEEITPTASTADLHFGAVRFVKLRAITDAAISTANTAVTIAISLIGVLALWLGLMKIAEAAGVIAWMVRLVQPILRPLFPEVPRGHPALGYIAVNLAGNILGLGNATTAMGLKAMEELQKLNPSDDTATDPMVMLLAIHTAAFQLVPSATLVAVMGFGAAEVFIPMLIVGFLATLIAILATKALGRLPMYRRTNPNLAVTARGEVPA